MRAPHLRPSLIVLVMVGGALGTAAREALTLSIPSTGSFPLATFLINIVGSFALGVLLEGLVRGGPAGGADTGRRRNLRLLAGTGFLGGFTTYSALSTDTVRLFAAGDVWTSILNAIGTLLIGLVAAWAGIVVAAAAQSRRNNRAAGA